jgi:hypothetical protein
VHVWLSVHGLQYIASYQTGKVFFMPNDPSR